MTYHDFVKSITKSGADIVHTTTPESAHLNHMALGIAGEAGELVDAIKKATIYNKPLDLPNVKEEVGDLLFYLAGVGNACGFSLDDAITANRAKLSVRYSAGSYSDKQAQERADK